MSENREEMDNIIGLVDEEGVEHDFELIDYFELDETAYAVLAPLDSIEDDENEGEAIILRVAKNAEGEEILENIEDDAEWEKAVNVWMEIMEEEDEGEE